MQNVLKVFETFYTRSVFIIYMFNFFNTISFIGTHIYKRKTALDRLNDDIALTWHMLAQNKQPRLMQMMEYYK